MKIRGRGGHLPFLGNIFWSSGLIYEIDNNSKSLIKSHNLSQSSGSFPFSIRYET